MNWFRRKKASRNSGLANYSGLSVGQVVSHKVTGEKAVIVRFEFDDVDGTINPIVSVGWYSSQEFSSTCAELEAWKPPQAVNAVAGT